MTVRALLRAILILVVLVAATCRADEVTNDYSIAVTTDRPESTEDEVRRSDNTIIIYIVIARILFRLTYRTYSSPGTHNIRFNMIIIDVQKCNIIIFFENFRSLFGLILILLCYFFRSL